MAEPFHDFELGKRYRLHEEMWPASRPFGTYNAGIALSGQYPKTEGIVVLARLGEKTRYGEAPRYGNRLDADVLVFSGEDRRGVHNARSVDQNPDAGANRALTESRAKGTPIYSFCAREEDKSWEYLGLGEVEAWSLEPRLGRLVVEYRIGLLGAANAAGSAVLEARAEAEVGSGGPPELTEPADRTQVVASRRARSRAFSKLVKREYGDRCAVCGSARADARGRAEVQAAHIYPVELNGRDDARNGLALCRLHHWAFDGALFGIDPNLGIVVLESGRGAAGVEEFDGKTLAVVPESETHRPHDLYLKERLALSRKRWTRSGEGDAK